MSGPDEGGRRPRRSLFERVLFSFMGPPQVGDVSAPPSVAADPEAALCRRCHRPWDEHEVVRTGSMTYAVCPGGPVAQETG